MSHVLFVTSSPRRGWQSYSHRTARGIVDDLKIQDPGVQVVVRDLARQPLPHTSEDYASSRALPADKRDQAAARALALSDAMVDELVAADVVVIAAPMHNFGIPSALKAWIDHIVRPGRTFSYSAQGPRGLARGQEARSGPRPRRSLCSAGRCWCSISRNLICARCSVSSA